MKERIWTWVGRIAWIVAIFSFIKVILIPWIETQGLVSGLKQLDPWLFLLLLSVGILLYELIMFFIRMSKKIATISQQGYRHDHAIENIKGLAGKIEIADQLKGEMKTLQEKHLEGIGNWREEFAKEISDWSNATVKKYHDLAGLLKKMETEMNDSKRKNTTDITSLQNQILSCQKKIGDLVKAVDADKDNRVNLSKLISTDVSGLEKRIAALEEKGKMPSPLQRMINDAAVEPVLNRNVLTVIGHIRITTPADESSVIRPGIVSGQVSNPNFRVWVIIHPIGGKYYVQEEANVNSDGKWTAGVHIGREGIADVGKQFEIKAFANPFEPLKEGEILETWTTAEYASETITVTRKS